MKKILISAAISLFSLHSFSQDSTANICEQREARLMETMNSFSASLLYNTYGLIGSIFDGFQSDTYDGKISFDLLTGQKKMVANLITSLERSIEVNLFRDDINKNYMISYISILKGFDTQIDMMLKIVKNNTKKSIDIYLALRNQSWKQINQLMGIKD